MRSSSAGAITRVVLHNPNAGATWRAGRTGAVLRKLARMPGTLVTPTVRGRITAQVRSLLTADVTSVFACGGDGTVSDVAAGLAGTDVALGIIPCGTTNTLCHEFGIPSNPLRAVDALAQATTTRIMRTWSVGAHTLVLGVGVGWDARLMYQTPEALKRTLGYFAFTPMGAWLGATYEFPELVVQGLLRDGSAITASGTSVLVSNSRHWAGPRAVFPESDPSDDCLQVILLERRTLGQLLPFWLHMMLPGGRPLDVAGVRTIEMRSLRITAPAAGSVEAHVNGDPIAHTPIVIEPAGAVRVLVPPHLSL